MQLDLNVYQVRRKCRARVGATRIHERITHARKLDGAGGAHAQHPP